MIQGSMRDPRVRKAMTELANRMLAEHSDVISGLDLDLEPDHVCIQDDGAVRMGLEVFSKAKSFLEKYQKEQDGLAKS